MTFTLPGAPVATTQPANTPVQPVSGGDTPTPAPATQPYPDVATVKKVCTQSPEANIAKQLPFLPREMVANQMTSKNQLVGVIATVYVETRGFDAIREVGRGGGRHGQYYGRGLLQLTWLDNYRKFSKASGVDVVANPDLVLQPEISAKAFMWYWLKGSQWDMRTFAEKGDWDNVRSIVNAGRPGRIHICHGVDVFRGAIKRGLEFFQSGIDPNSIGAASLPGSYGMSDLDSQGGTVTAGFPNPNSPADALAMALNLYNLNYYRTHQARLIIDAHAQPDILKLRAQDRFKIEGVGEEIDGEYTAEDIIIHGGNRLEVEIRAYHPDPNAPKVPQQIIRHDSTAPVVNANLPIPQSGNIQQRVWAASEAARGRDSSMGPDGGNLACAYAVNRFVLIPAGIKPLGPGQFGSDAVRYCLKDLQNGRGQKIPWEQGVPGDIWIDWSGSGHIGIVATAGSTEILSNSSSKARFSWQGTMANYDRYYGGKRGDNCWRLLN